MRPPREMSSGLFSREASYASSVALFWSFLSCKSLGTLYIVSSAWHWHPTSARTRTANQQVKHKNYNSCISLLAARLFAYNYSIVSISFSSGPREG